MKLSILTLVFFAWVGQLHAQYFDKTYSLALDINKPISNTDYISQVSARGFKFGYREMITEKLFGGVDFSNSTFTKHKPRQTYYNGTSAITTDVFNYAYNYGLTLSVDYFFKNEQRLLPYAGLGVGASYMSYRQYFNVYQNENHSWGVLLRPQAGVLFKPKEDSGWAFQASLHYDYSSTKSADFDLKAFHNIGVQVGVIILDW